MRKEHEENAAVMFNDRMIEPICRFPGQMHYHPQQESDWKEHGKDWIEHNERCSDQPKPDPPQVIDLEKGIYPIKINSSADSAIFQKQLFEHGIAWATGAKCIQYEDLKLLCIENGSIHALPVGDCSKCDLQCPSNGQYMTAQEFLSWLSPIQRETEQSQFKEGDKVRFIPKEEIIQLYPPDEDGGCLLGGNYYSMYELGWMCGKVFTIRKMEKFIDNNNGIISINEITNWWPAEILTPVLPGEICADGVACRKLTVSEGWISYPYPFCHFCGQEINSLELKPFGIEEVMTTFPKEPDIPF